MSPLHVSFKEIVNHAKYGGDIVYYQTHHFIYNLLQDELILNNKRKYSSTFDNLNSYATPNLLQLPSDNKKQKLNTLEPNQFVKNDEHYNCSNIEMNNINNCIDNNNGDNIDVNNDDNNNDDEHHNCNNIKINGAQMIVLIIIIVIKMPRTMTITMIKILFVMTCKTKTLIIVLMVIMIILI
jgi:hypothetical protein